MVARLDYCLAAGIVRGQGQVQVAAEAMEELGKIGGPGADIFRRIKGVVGAKAKGGGGHELHETHGPLWRYGAGIET